MTHPATVTVLSTHPAAANSTVTRKLVVEVVEARELLPKDGQGSSSPYVVVDFDGQRKRTKTIVRDLNPVWNEALEFIVVDPKTMEAEELDVEVYNDKRTSGGSRRNHFLGRVKLYGTQFARRGEEGLVYFTLEKKSVFSWIRGVLGLRIYYYDEILVVEELKQEIPPPPPENEPDQLVGTAPDPPPQQYLQDPPQPENERFVCQVPSDAALETNDPPEMDSHGTAVNMVDDTPRPPIADPAPETVPDDHPLMQEHSPVVRRMQSCGTAHATTERVKGLRRPNGDNFAPRVIPTRFADLDRMVRIPSHQLVEPMQYLFVRIVKARGLAAASENTYVKVRAGNHFARSKPAVYQLRTGEAWPEWNQVFALAHNTVGSTLEIYVWDGPADAFLGGVCFDLSDVPVRDPPDSPLAPQWYRLEGADERSRSHVSGDIMLSVWIGTQADDAFPESWNSDAQYVAHTRSKVYQSPKLWYLRVSVIEAQDLQVLHSSGPSDVRVKAQLGFQSARTRRSSSASHHSSSFSWHEDLVFVAGEPLEDQIILLVEDRTVVKEVSLLGHVIVPISKIEQRLDERNAATKWYNLDGGANGYAGRIHLRLCLEGGYHVLDEAAHVCSDFRPTAKQLWKPAVGVLELGILGARALVPMKTKGGGGAKGSTDAYSGAKGSTDAYCGAKGSTDAYCVAKYGKKWVRTRTITDSFDPRWNEQYTWQVYDPCTVLTVGVFDNWRMFGEDRPDYRIGKVRIRVSTLESNRVYTNSYPLVILRPGGVKKMGEIEVAVRFSCPSLLPDTCAVYGQPLLPRMHYLRPLGVAQQEALRGAATRMVAGWLARSEPPLGYEVVRYMLDADSHAWSMRKSKANWFRILGVLAWVVGLARWTEDVRTWRNPVTTVLVHILYLVLVWYPELIVPTGFLYVFLVGAWYYRFKPKIPAGMDVRLSQADAVDPDELDEEFDPVPSTKPADVVRARYDRLRVLAARIQTVLGDVATQGERVQALVSWRDPRATKMFMFLSLLVALVLYTVPPKMVAVALGFYFLRHPMFRDPMPPASLNFFRRLPSLSDRLI